MKTGRATPGEVVAKLVGAEEVSWGSRGAFQVDLARAAKVPVTYNGQSAWHSLQPLIQSELAAEAVKADPHLLPSVVLRRRVMAIAGLDTASARHVNFHAWALAMLVDTGGVAVHEVRGPRGGVRRLYSVPLAQLASGVDPSGWPVADASPPKPSKETPAPVPPEGRR